MISFASVSISGKGGIDFVARNLSVGSPFKDVGKHMTGLGFFGRDLGNTEIIECRASA